MTLYVYSLSSTMAYAPEGEICASLLVPQPVFMKAILFIVASAAVTVPVILTSTGWKASGVAKKA